MDDLENACVGLFLALYAALERDAQGTATECLTAYVADARTPAAERRLYSDVLDCITPNQPPSSLLELATIH